MPERRNEFASLVDEAIHSHRCNIAKAEIRKGELGLAAPDVLDDIIAKSELEIERLGTMKEKADQNHKIAIKTNGESLDQISAQISGLKAEMLLFRQDVRTDIGDLRGVVLELRDGCPLFNADTPEGPLVFVRKQE